MVPRTSTRPSASRAWFDGVGDLARETVAIGLAHDAHAVDRASGLAGEQRDQRVHLAGPAEEGHLDAAGVVLVDQHADMDARLQEPRELHRGVEAGRDQIRP